MGGKSFEWRDPGRQAVGGGKWTEMGGEGVGE